jgi:hypothetical protein
MSEEEELAIRQLGLARLREVTEALKSRENPRFSKAVISTVKLLLLLRELNTTDLPEKVTKEGVDILLSLGLDCAFGKNITEADAKKFMNTVNMMLDIVADVNDKLLKADKP